MEEAARCIRRWVPLSLRAKFASFRSPKWAKDPGPMRVIILDNRTNEQVGTWLCDYIQKGGTELGEDLRGDGGLGRQTQEGHVVCIHTCLE